MHLGDSFSYRPVHRTNILVKSTSYELILTQIYSPKPYRYSVLVPNIFQTPWIQVYFNRLPSLTQRDRGTRWCSWLRHCVTRWKVAGSIPDCVIGIFHWRNLSGRTTALGSTQPLTETSTRNISWGIKAAGAYGWQIYHLHVPIVLKSGSLNLLQPSRPVQVCKWIALPSTLWWKIKFHTHIKQQVNNVLFNLFFMFL